jgi:aspartate aminotransferase
VEDRFQEEVLMEFRKRREIAIRMLSQIPSFTVPPVSGAFYLFPKYAHKMSSEKFALKILENGVICAPGSAFGTLGEGHLRFSYANSRENIERGLVIVKELAARL